MMALGYIRAVKDLSGRFGIHRDTGMINELQASKSCYSFKQNAPLTAKAISELFQDVRLGQYNPSNNHFPHSSGNSFWRYQERATGRPYFVQLYWLLSSLLAACTEVGAFGCVICQKG